MHGSPDCKLWQRKAACCILQGHVAPKVHLSMHPTATLPPYLLASAVFIIHTMTSCGGHHVAVDGSKAANRPPRWSAVGGAPGGAEHARHGRGGHGMALALGHQH